MSHKIQIDLCEIFGVKEGQEFSIDKTKYKIENNILQTGFGDFWVKMKKLYLGFARNMKSKLENQLEILNFKQF